MLIEIHMIQNHSPANLNRDDLGAPKTCMFGGVMRARISSQCLKRSIRRSSEFRKALEKDGGVRTRRLVHEIAKRALGVDDPDDLSENLKNKLKEKEKNISEVFKKGGLGIGGVEGDPNATDILWFVPNSAIDKMAEIVKNGGEDLGKKFAKILEKKAAVPDIALSGRMIEFDGKNHFKDLRSKLGVEAALSAAHAISTHEVINEVDYFTAVDDLATGTGAGHVNEAMFNSACFYKYFCIDWNQLVENLDGHRDLRDLAKKTVECFIRAAALTTPSGKQHAHAAFNPPEGILVEVKKESPVPMNYANAFADPVPAKCKRGLVGESIARLGHYVHEIVEGYSITAERFWFSPAGRYQLTWIDKKANEPEKEKMVIDGANGAISSLDELVRAVLDTMDRAKKEDVS